jgi:hypothetical protein
MREHMAKHSTTSVRKLYEKACSSGNCSKILAAGCNRPAIDSKSVKAYDKKRPLQCCGRLYGPSVCEAMHDMKILKVAHREMYAFVSSLWYDDVMEGAFVARFVANTDIGQVIFYAFLGRKQGNPRRLMWQGLHAANSDQDLDSLPCRLSLRRLQDNNYTGWEIAQKLLVTSRQRGPGEPSTEFHTLFAEECLFRDLSMAEIDVLAVRSKRFLWRAGQASAGRRRAPQKGVFMGLDALAKEETILGRSSKAACASVRYDFSDPEDVGSETESAQEEELNVDGSSDGECPPIGTVMGCHSAA